MNDKLKAVNNYRSKTFDERTENVTRAVEMIINNDTAKKLSKHQKKA